MTFKARPTTYKGIKMRSRLEAGFAAWMDETGYIDWKYEPRAYASENGQYLPDFELLNVRVKGSWPRPPAKLFVEIKPSRPDDTLLFRLGRILCASEPRAYLAAIWPDGESWGIRLITPSARWANKQTGETRELCAAYADDAVWTSDIPALAPDVTQPGSLHNEVVHKIDVPLKSPWSGEYWKPRDEEDA